MGSSLPRFFYVIIGSMLVKSILRLLAFFTCLIPMTVFASTPAWDQIYKKLKPSIPYIYSNGGLCSGALIDHDLILTAKHCVETLRPIWISWPSAPGKWELAEVAYMHSTLDFALVKIEKRTEPSPIPMRKLEYVREGEAAATIGHPTSGKTLNNPPFDLDLTHVFSSGTISKNTGTELVIDLSLSPGNSGGPLIDSNGEIIGVISRKLITQFVGNVGYAVSHNAALAAYALYKQEKLSPPNFTNIPPGFSVAIIPTWDAFQNNLPGMNSTYRTVFTLEYTIVDRLLINYSNTLGLNGITLSSWGLGWNFQTDLPNKVPVFFKPQIETISYNPKAAPAKYHSVAYTAELGMGGLPLSFRLSLLRAYGDNSFMFGLRFGN